MESDSISLYEDNNTLPWYHGKVTRAETVRLLTLNEKTDGLFLVADSVLHGDFILYLCHDDFVFEHRIYSYTNFLSLDNVRFYATLEDLINYYRNNFYSNCVLETKLERYVVKTKSSELIPWRKVKIQRLCYGEYGKVILGRYNHRRVALTSIRHISDVKILLDKCVYHENLMNMMGMTIYEDEFYLMNEYSQYRCLQKFLKSRKKKRISNNSIICCAYDISSGMYYLEKLLICHKQLATKNIFISRTGIAKLGNFGLGEDLPPADKSHLLRWMAPETIRTDMHTSKSDVWSFGVCLWEISTCARLPYEDTSYQDIYKTIQSGYRLPKPDHCKDEFYEIMEMCWRWTANERPTFQTINSNFEEKRRQRFSLSVAEPSDDD